MFGKKTKKEPLPEKIFETEAMSAVDLIAPASIEVKPSYSMLGERMTKSFFIFSYPRYLTTSWFSPVINLDIPMDISFFIHPIDAGLILKQLRRRVTEVQAELMEREEKGLIRDPALETAYRDIEELRDRLQTAQERMFQLGLYLTAYADTKEEMDSIETSLRSILESRLIYIKPALYQQKEGFVTTSPYCLDKLDVHAPMNTEPLSSVFPFVSFDLSSNEGILYGVNQHNNSLVLFDRFSLENANFCVFAQSGAGKSVLGSESVLVKNKGEIQLTKIGPLVEKIIEKRGIAQIDEELEGVINPGIEVYSFDKNLKGEWSQVTIAARKKATDFFYKFTTRSGREITTTGDHNMLVLKNGKEIPAKSSGMQKGEFVPLPRSVSNNTDSPNSINLLQLLKDSEGVYVNNAGNLIKENYQTLHKTIIDKRLDRYLYKYRDGRIVPIQYFWEILNHLNIKATDPNLKNIGFTSKLTKGRKVFNRDFEITPSFLKLAGYIAAEGTIRENCVMISNDDPEVLKDIDSSFKNLGIPFYYGNRGIICACRVFIEIIKTLGGKGKSKQKKVLPLIFNLEKEKVSQYLAAYFEGDGGVEPRRFTVTATSKSDRLISEISYLLFYFGIISRIGKTKKKPTNSNWKKRRTYWRLTISGQDSLRKFAKSINFVSERKREQLSKIIEKEGNTNVDLIPKVGPIFKEIRQLFGFQLHHLPQISDWARNIRLPSPQSLQKTISQIEERIRHFKDLSATFRILSELPELSPIIDLGKNSKNLNKELWQALGQSWRVVKNEGVRPGCQNAFKIIEAVNGISYSAEDSKQAIYSGFQEMDLPVKYYNRHLQTALVDRPESDTNYETIQKTAQYIWQNYQEVLTQKIPQVEEKLAQLKTLANSNLFWDPIAKIEKIKNRKEKYVYDLTVDNEVFLAGQGGMFVHNSYMVKLEVLRSLMVGINVIIVDPENEYEMLSEAVGGSYFKISLSSESHINPFDLPVPREDENPEDVLRANVINLVGLMRLMLGGLTPEEDAIMDRALTETYAAKDITPKSDFSKIEPPLMSDLEAVLETMEGADSLLKRVRKFTKGTYANFFNQPSNVDMKNKLVVFGIRDMEEGLRPMAMYIIMRYIWNQIRSELKKRIFVVDEAWWLMKSDDGASFLFGITKRARKYWLGVTTITQDVGDFMKSDYGKPIITNSALQFLMKQSPATTDVLQKTFNLTDWEKEMLLSSGVGEGLFFAGQKHVALRVVASPVEDKFITTSPEEVLKIKEAKKKLARE